MLRLCSVFEPPATALTGAAARYDPVGGMQSHTGQLTRALDACGVAQTVVTAWRPGGPDVSGWAAAPRSCASAPRPPPPPAVRRGGRALLRGIAAADLVHVHLREDLAVVPLGLLASHRHRPLVLTVHCSLRHTLEAAGARVSTVGAALESVGERRAAAVICSPGAWPTGCWPRAWTPAGPGHPLRGGPARLRRPPARSGPRATRPRVLFVGRLAAQKGVATLLEAVPLLRNPAPVVLVGDGPLRPALERQAGRLGPGRVCFRGFVPHAEVPAWLAAAGVLVLPSVCEELGSVLLEAMAAGLPVVASAVGGIPDALGDAGRLVPPGDPAALAATVDEILEDPALAAGLGKAARRRATAFSWDRLAGRVLNLYREVAGCG